MHRVVRLAVLTVAIIGSMSVAGASQATQPETLSALLVEVRALRMAMEQMASAGPRIQLAMGRLQMQEQRVNNLVRRLDTIRADINTSEREADEAKEQVATFERMIKEADSPGNTTEPDEANLFKAQIGAIKRMAERAAANIDRLRAEEAQILADIGAEQARWATINQQLDELERSMTRK